MIKRNITFFLLVFSVLNLMAQPRPVKLSSTIIIDTDCGLDDMRAISLLLSRPELTVKAILTSDGSLSPMVGAGKVLSLLQEFNMENIPVACGDEIKAINPAWRPFCTSIIWGRQPVGQIIGVDAADYLLKAIKSENEKITVVCLGSLRSIYQVLKKDAGIASGIDRIVWYNESVKPPQGFNYECDRESADKVLKSNIRIDVISNLNLTNALFDTSIIEICKQSDTHLAQTLEKVFIQPPVIETLNKNHFRLSDDLVALYITNPELFQINTDLERLNIRYNTGYDIQGVREAIGDMIRGVYVSEHNVVFNRFPVQREMFDYDIRPIIDSAIARYGYEEWKANVMTDEFHGHLGVFSIVGAKMGIKAREIFGVGPDMLEVITSAGTKPPYSCLTDGIQVSTGATLGMATISLDPDPEPRPSAVFTYKDRSIRITLKKEYLNMVDSDINEGIIKFGLVDDGYWKLIRQNAIKYWLEWDRNKIFEIEEIK